MTDFVRRLVSGNKARFKDGHLNLELDLVYITDQVVIMGYPAAGLEGLYRNRREDAKKFLEHRHGKNFWVYNFCPVRENSYPASFFDGRVSRYPFPDHHAPPLPLLPLVARDMRAWLSGSPERVAVLHCKAGKGRSGTLACTYLLSLEDGPSPPRLERSYTAKQWAKVRAEEWMQAIPQDDASPEALEANVTDVNDDQPANRNSASPILDSQPTDTPQSISPSSTPSSAQPPAESFTNSLKGVLDLHTSRRMKTPSSLSKKVKQGVSIPSQRRWLHYWSLLLSGEAPLHLWQFSDTPETPRPKVRLTQVKLRMRETSGMKINLVKAANIVLDRSNLGKNGVGVRGKGHVWVSLARYDDEFVGMLEKWERHTRDGEGHMGKRKEGSDHIDGEALSKMFDDEKWDRKKMIHSFARLGAVGEHPIQKVEVDKEEKVLSYVLRPLSDDRWDSIREELKEDVPEEPVNNSIPSETNSMYDVTQAVRDEGVILDSGREVRIKLYMGQVFMGWLWFIPAFHMPQPPSALGKTNFVLTREYIDFPLGVGADIIDVEVSLEWSATTEAVQPPARQTSEEEGEPSGVAATVQAITASGNVEDAVHAKQAAEE